MVLHLQLQPRVMLWHQLMGCLQIQSHQLHLAIRSGMLHMVTAPCWRAIGCKMFPRVGEGHCVVVLCRNACPGTCCTEICSLAVAHLDTWSVLEADRQ